uniref:Integral membrane protein n=1 Tax=Streptomyces sp. NBC_00093 TaxID=2975649 RepID=A0AAU1ZXY6_9ACTN
MSATGRLGVVGGATVVFVGWGVAAVLTEVPVLLVGLPVVGAGWVLVVLDSGYRLGREWAHRRRRRRSRATREVWAPRAGVRRPLEYPGVVASPTVDDPVDRQGRFRATGIRLAVLPALAVLFLTVESAFLAQGSPLALGFVCAECLLLVAMIWTVRTEQEPSRPWVTSRTRAELFRREQYLLVASAGPYLGLTPTETEQVRDVRLNLIAHAGPAQLDAFTRLGDPAADGTLTYWHDEVWRRPAAAPAADATDRMRTYLDHRIRRQSLFFELAAGTCERTERTLGRVAKGAILAGIAVALCYAVLLAAGRADADRSTAAMTIALLAAGLPPLCNSVLAIQNLFATQRLAASYRQTRQELDTYENTLCKLLNGPPGADPAEAGRAFRALVVGVETTLTEELRRWRIIVAKPEFDAGL